MPSPLDPHADSHRTAQQPDGRHELGRHGLGAHCVGQRVVVRRLVPGETGPTGGPAFTDVLGVMEAWGPGTTAVRRDDGSVVHVEIALIVSGKPVPPRPSPRLRVPVEEAEHRALAGWPAVTAEPLGSWVLRAAGGFSSRANSVLAVGDPGVPFDQALDTVGAFYSAQGLPARAQVVSGSDQDDAFTAAGWVPARPGEADTLFQIGSVSRASRLARSLLPVDPPVAARGTTLTPAWLATDDRARLAGDAARAVLEGSDLTVFVTVPDAGPGTGEADAAGTPVHGRPPALARGRAAGGAEPDWVGVTDVWVAPDERRRGLALVVLLELLNWAAEQGATTAYLQVRGDNPAALGLYERLGFATHHAYRYLRPA
jgi:ribosomal protein S18 acetylase RimI-like enzyme